MHIIWLSLLWLQLGLREPDKIVRDLATLAKKSIEVVKGERVSIAAERKVVHVDSGEILADHLVISLGA